jgi:hypothetical protein
VGGLTNQRQKRLKGAIKAPMGQNTLQKDRELNMAKMMMPARKARGMKVASPLNENPLETRFGILAWSVAAGQTRQKEYHVSEPSMEGISSTKKISTPYLI